MGSGMAGRWQGSHHQPNRTHHCRLGLHRLPSFAQGPSNRLTGLINLSASLEAIAEKARARRLTILSWDALRQSHWCSKLQLAGVHVLRANASGDALPGRVLERERLILISGHLVVLGDGLVAQLAPPHAIFDLGAGCCRPDAVSCRSQGCGGAHLQWVENLLSEGLTQLSQQLWRPHWAIRGLVSWLHACSSRCFLRQRRPSHQSADDAVYLLTFSHSSTYFHAVRQALPRLLFGMALLQSNPRIRIVHSSSAIIPRCLEAFGLGGRGLFRERPLLAPAVIVPPGADGTASIDGPLLRATASMLQHGVDAKPLISASSSEGGSNVTLLVRRDTETGTGRGVYNHAALLHALQDHVGRSRVVVFEPQGVSLAETVHLWSTATLVVAPHGAGLTNLMFCQPGAVVVELYREGNPSGIYQAMADIFGLRYVPCRHSDGRATTDYGTSSFLLNITWFFLCLQAHGVR